MKNYILIVKLAINAILHNKFRAFLTMLGIIIGVSAVIAIMSIGAGAQSLITSSIKDVGTDVIRVLPGASDEEGPPASAFGIVITTLTYEDAKEIKKLPYVKDVTAYITGNTEISHEGKIFVGDYRGVNSTYEFVENHFIDQGRFFTEQENETSAKVAVIGTSIKEELFPYSNPIGEKIKIGNQFFKIIGLLEQKESSMFQNYDKQILVPLKTAQNLLLNVNHVSLISVKVESEEKVDVTTERIKETLRYRHGIKDPENDDFSVRALSSALDTFTTITDGIRFFLAAIAAISLIVGGIGITNIMFMTVKERTREIGLRKAIGAKPFHIKNQFIIEAIVLTVLGGVFGIIVGILLSLLVSVGMNFLEYRWDFVIPPMSIVLSVIVSIIIGVTFGFYPAKKASELNPIDALRYE